MSTEDRQAAQRRLKELLTMVRAMPAQEQLTRLVDEGHVDPLVGETLPLDQAPQALAKLADRSTVGKVVLVP